MGIEVRASRKLSNTQSDVKKFQSHICILQSALDLVERGYDVHVLADGVSSCNKEEIPFAFARMRQAGVQVTTSESAAYQLMCTSNVSNALLGR